MIKFKIFFIPLLGPLLFILVAGLDLDLTYKQQTFLGIFIFVVYNWLIGHFPLFVTGILGVGISVLFGIETAVASLASFANPIIFLFLAGFLFAKAMNETGLDRRISLVILSQNFMVKSFDRLLFCLLGLTAFFSMWVSNTATTAMMMPIMLGTAKSLNIKDPKTLGLMLLALAYASSVGGLGTPVGSPPNIVAIGMLKELANIHVSFAQWTLVGIPLVFVFLIIIFLYTRNRIPFENKRFDSSFLKAEAASLPPMSSDEKYLIFFFLILLSCWFLPGLLNGLLGDSYYILRDVDARMEPGIVGILLASLLFIFPLGQSTKLLKMEDIRAIDWGSLLLFGSGLALGKMLFSTGLAELAGNFLVHHVTDANILILFTGITFFTIFFTELASNTATANIVIPIVIASSGLFQLNPTLLAIAVGLSCSLAFMLPVATPPNAIVYGSGMVELQTMVKFGLILNIIFGLIISLLFYGLNILLF